MSRHYSISKPSVPTVSAERMREVDRLMEEQYGVALLQMMENAGRNLAHLARRRYFDGDARNGQILVLAGSGGNGGGGLVCARRLHNWGADVRVWLTKPADELGAVPRRQLGILEAMGLPVTNAHSGVDRPAAGLVVAAIIGYSLSGAPTGSAAALVAAASRHAAPVLSLDTPSGLDPDTGVPHEPAIRADATMTLALPKTGLLATAAAEHVGELYLADISVPPALYSALGITVGPIFARCDVVRLT